LENATPTPGEAERNDYHANLVIPTKSNKKQIKTPSNLLPQITEKDKSSHEPVINDGIKANGVLQQLKNEILEIFQTLRNRIIK
jgi:hypothetical protein